MKWPARIQVPKDWEAIVQHLSGDSETLEATGDTDYILPVGSRLVVMRPKQDDHDSNNASAGS